MGHSVDNGEPVRRTSEIEEVTNFYVIHPLASRLVPVFAALRISPNAVSIVGMLFGISAGFAYYHYRALPFAIAGFVLMVAWHVMDGADGQLARLTHSQSQLGKVLDGICDYVTFIAVYSALALSLSRQFGNGIWALAIGAGVCHAVQSAAYELQRQEYDFWGRGKLSMKLPELQASTPQRMTDRLYQLYARMQLAVAGVDPAFQRQFAEKLEAEPRRAAEIRAHYRDAFAPAVRGWSVMSANYRTLGIFITALFKAPQYYFWFEIVGFSAILAVLLARQRARRAQFLQSLAAFE